MKELLTIASICTVLMACTKTDEPRPSRVEKAMGKDKPKPPPECKDCTGKPVTWD